MQDFGLVLAGLNSRLHTRLPLVPGLLGHPHLAFQVTRLGSYVLIDSVVLPVVHLTPHAAVLSDLEDVLPAACDAGGRGLGDTTIAPEDGTGTNRDGTSAAGFFHGFRVGQRLRGGGPG